MTTEKKSLCIDIITLFPEMVGPYLHGSILGRGEKAKALSINVHQLRDWTHDRHKTVDDKPFGGGPGMVMKVAPFHEALESLELGGALVSTLAPSGSLGRVYNAPTKGSCLVDAALLFAKICYNQMWKVGL